jgi:20S proteasome alpha/beta subunit
VESSESKSLGNQLLSPIKSFGPSWAASAAHGTTVALHCSLQLNGESMDRTDAVLLVFRHRKLSPASPWSTTHSAPTIKENWQIIDGLKITGPVYHSADSLSGTPSTLCANPRRWIVLGSTAVCSMTGLASDVDYLTSIIQSQVEDHRYIYDGASAARTSVLPTSQILEMLAENLRKETLYENQRPLGVQVLLVGRDPKPFGSSTATFKLFTFDPSGGFRHFGLGAAIGRSAAEVRMQLQEDLLSKSAAFKETGAKTLEACLRSFVKARLGEAMEGGNLVDQYDALLLWEEQEQFCVASVDPQQVDEIRKKISTDLHDGA